MEQLGYNLVLTYQENQFFLKQEHLLQCLKNGNRIIVGSPQYDILNFFGRVRVYEINGNTWSQVGNSIDGIDQQTYLGKSVSISGDGNRILIGAPDWTRSNVQTEGYGFIAIYDLSGNTWTSTELISGNYIEEQVGSSVSLSNNGNVIVFGALHQNSTDSGYVRAFQYQNNEETPTGDICFPAGTPVQTDQGEIAIEKLTSENTIDGVNVVAVVPVYNECDYLVKINKHALGPNYPKKTTLVSRNHRVFVDKKGGDKSVPALTLYNGKTVTVVQREIHETIYNVLLPTYSKMTINGLVVETLHPKSVYAKK